MTRLLVLALVVLACRREPAGQNPTVSSSPGGQDTVPIAGHSLYVPTGFTVTVFGAGHDGVRSLALGPGGAVFATLPDGGRIVRLLDSNGDGVADSARTVLSGLEYPFGLAFRGDTMYFAEETAVKRLDPGAATPVRSSPTSRAAGTSRGPSCSGPTTRSTWPWAPPATCATIRSPGRRSHATTSTAPGRTRSPPGSATRWVSPSIRPPGSSGPTTTTVTTSGMMSRPST